jgi:Zn-dependent peptidase ImmA (M78 family)/transcriptional regulator with XRE-family HTH domain
MTVGVAAFDGKRLKEARLARGLFKNALADMIGVSGTAITRYEECVDKPQHDRLVAIAQKLNFPFEFFLRPTWPESLAPVFWRSRTAETKYARAMTEQRMFWLCEIFSFLEREVNFPSVNLPEVDLPDDFRAITPDLIERAADDLRYSWRLNDYPIPDVTLALENAGIPVVNIEISSDKQDGFFFRSSLLGRLFVGVNTYGMSASRARYDVAHELGHAIMHKNVSPQQTRDPALHKLLEQQAHRFAGAFLFPSESFIFEVRNTTLDYFCSLKKCWGMSIAAMVYRAFDLGLVDENEKTVLYRNMTRRGWRGSLREPFDDPSIMPMERPRMLRRAVEVVADHGILGPSAIRAGLSLPDREIEQLIGLGPGFFAKGELLHLAVAKREPLTSVDLESGEIIEFPQRNRR